MTDLRWVRPLVTLLQTRADEERREALVGQLRHLADLPTNRLQTGARDSVAPDGQAASRRSTSP
jgi:hypothetical protein